MDNTLTVDDFVTLDPRLGESGRKGKVTRLMSNGWVMVQWLTGDLTEKREHRANLCRLEGDHYSNQTMVALGLAPHDTLL